MYSTPDQGLNYLWYPKVPKKSKYEGMTRATPYTQILRITAAKTNYMAALCFLQIKKQIREHGERWEEL